MVPLKIADKISAISVLLLILLTLHYLKPSPSSPSSPTLPGHAHIYVQVDGEVKHPGVYAFSREPSAGEALLRAIVLKRKCKEVDLSQWSALPSGSKILVLYDGQTCKILLSEMGAHYKVSLGISLSVNSECQEGFTAIPGIGVKLAGAIVRERERRGGFKTVDEISGVPGIKKALFRKIKPYLSL
ncbi:MAG: helix-hairpin-helix domain-containing protein [Deltaproteobacteria bacterium]|nr:helix-hairpin-helix domain-containing protein [Deltaproteobacteria bacterium]